MKRFNFLSIKSFLENGSPSPKLLPHSDLLALFKKQVRLQKDWLTHHSRFQWKPLALLYQEAVRSTDDKEQSWCPDVHEKLNINLNSELNSLVQNFSSSENVPLSVRTHVSDVCRHVIFTQIYLQMLSNRPHLIRSSDCVAVAHLVRNVIDDMGALSREKFGVCPAIHVNKTKQVTNFLAKDTVVVESLFRFVMTEILKNAIGATVNRFGILNVEDSPAILIDLPDSSLTELCITNFGDKIPKDIQPYICLNIEKNLPNCAAEGFSPSQSSLLFTSHVQNKKDMHYHYSRQFGTPFAGLQFASPIL
jgi:hypothetical protein